MRNLKALVFGVGAMACIAALAWVGTSAVPADQPTSQLYGALPADAIAVVEVPPIDLDEVRFEDQLREADGLAPRYAIPWKTNITPQADGTWEQLDSKTMLWRLRIVSPGAYSLNLGFTRYYLPHNAKLFVYATDGSYYLRPFTEQDNAEHGQLWTPVVLADDIMVELSVPVWAVDEVELELTSINHGYRGFGKSDGADKAGSCNVDVICPEGDDWRDEIPSVGVISTGGYLFCTGFMVNNTAQDETPYFMTADHCGVDSSNAASLVVYWNFESPTCGQQGGGSLSQYQTGSFFRAAYSTSDFTLVELDSPPDPAWGITFAGWDRSGNDASMAVAIHHPSTDEKSISFEYQSTQVTSYLGYSSPGDGTHVRVVDWDVGTTEPGSSGSPLFNQNHHVIGQLHGGYAACGNDESDWYGAFARSWTGGGSNSTRLSNWLDPLGTGAVTLDTLNPNAAGMRVSPSTAFNSQGDPGGPFTPASQVYTIENVGSTGINYSVTKTANWLSISNASGYLAPGATVDVTVSINSNANSLGVGVYTDQVNFINTTDHLGDTVRPVELQVGGPALIYSWNMDTNPGWTTQGDWAFGQPTGGGGQYGYRDPTSGHTGSNVYGYNLNGDYPNNLPERHLTTTAIDCSNLAQVTLKFWRYLNVEQPAYDHAYVRVSTDGSSWKTIWENTAEVTDNSWRQVEFDISAIADGQPTVYIRWTMGTTDSSWQYSGWNIDDVEIWAIDQSGGVEGDVDGDGDVDLTDLALLLAAYNTCAGDANFNPNADFNGDGCVDLADLSVLLAAYGS